MHKKFISMAKQQHYTHLNHKDLNLTIKNGNVTNIRNENIAI